MVYKKSEHNLVLLIPNPSKKREYKNIEMNVNDTE